jgi:DNA invertase Pin-like site-specific DNA recombinase
MMTKPHSSTHVLQTIDAPVAALSVSERTRAALSQAKARGVVLGKAGAENIRATVEKRKATADAFAEQHRALFSQWVGEGWTHRRMAEELNARGIAAARGGAWTHGQVQRILNRYAAMNADGAAQ